MGKEKGSFLNNKLANNLFYAMSAQTLALILNIIMTLLVSKFISIEQFSYWQLFLFYSSYVGFFHLGLSDGLYLRLGGKKYEELDYELIGSEIKLSIIIESVLSIIIIVFSSLFISDSSKEYVFLCTGVYLVVANAFWIIGYVFQAVNQTKIYSIATIIDKILFISSIFVLLILRIDSFIPYVLIFLATRCIALIYAILHGKKLIFSKITISLRVWCDILTNIKVGINLMLANIASSLIIGIGRQITEIAWGITAFGKFSFAVSLTNFFLQFISQISMVLFPALRQTSKEQLTIVYSKTREGLGFLLPLVFIAYIPIKALLSIWLPQYQESLRYLELLLPICTYDGKMQMVSNTYLKVLREEKMLLRINIITMIISTFLCTVSAFMIDNVYFVIISMVAAIVIRSIIAELYVASKLEIKVKSKNMISELAIAIVFMFVTWNMSGIYAMFIITISYIIFLLINSKETKQLFNKIIRLISCYLVKSN